MFDKKKYGKIYYQKNKDKILQQQKVRLSNPDTKEIRNKYFREKRRSDGGEIKTYQRSYYLKHKTRIRTYQREYYKKNPEFARKKAVSREEYRLKCKLDTYKVLGNKCKICGFKDIRALQIDHINSDGKNDRVSGGYRYQFYKRVLASVQAKEKRYQLLCANCNWIKRYTHNEHYQPDRREV